MLLKALGLSSALHLCLMLPELVPVWTFGLAGGGGMYQNSEFSPLERCHLERSRCQCRTVLLVQAENRGGCVYLSEQLENLLRHFSQLGLF